jgi:hypothetical protein
MLLLQLQDVLLYIVLLPLLLDVCASAWLQLSCKQLH